MKQPSYGVHTPYISIKCSLFTVVWYNASHAVTQTYMMSHMILKNGNTHRYWYVVTRIVMMYFYNIDITRHRMKISSKTVVCVKMIDACIERI